MGEDRFNVVVVGQSCAALRIRGLGRVERWHFERSLTFFLSRDSRSTLDRI